MLFKPDAGETESGSATVTRTDGASWLGRALRRLVSITIVLIIVGGLGYITWTAFKPQTRGNIPRDLPVPVLAATPHLADVPVYVEGVGTIRALNTVTVRAQVDGRLLSVNFVEGQDVKQGDVLAEIDPVLYKAQLDATLAKKAQDEATLANARLDLARYQQLAQTNAGSKQQADTQRALVAQLEAQVRADQASIDTAQTNLNYTKIVAPISGRAGLRQVDQGNIIRASDTTGLVVITQVKPIAVWFSLPQQQLPRVNEAASKRELPVDVFGGDGRTVIESGKLLGIDNQVDSTTGTVKLKAQFPNEGLRLWPGQFVNVRMKIDTLAQAVVVPTSSVQRGPAGTYAYVIGPDNTVTAKPVSVTQQTDTEAVIASGLTPADRIVTTGFANLAEGSRIIIGQGSSAPTPDLAPRRKSGSGQPKGQKGQGQQGQTPAASGPSTAAPPAAPASPPAAKQ